MRSQLSACSLATCVGSGYAKLILLLALLVGGLGFIGKCLIKSLSGSHTLVGFSDAEGAQRACDVHWVRQPSSGIGDITDEVRLKEVILETMRFGPGNEKLESASGYCHPTTLSAGLRRTLEWYVRHTSLSLAPQTSH